MALSIFGAVHFDVFVISKCWWTDTSLIIANKAKEKTGAFNRRSGPSGVWIRGQLYKTQARRKHLTQHPIFSLGRRGRVLDVNNTQTKQFRHPVQIRLSTGNTDIPNFTNRETKPRAFWEEECLEWKTRTNQEEPEETYPVALKPSPDCLELKLQRQVALHLHHLRHLCSTLLPRQYL